MEIGRGKGVDGHNDRQQDDQQNFPLEKKTKKNNRNSSKPSSQTGKDETSSQPGTNGKGKQQNGALTANTRTVETTQVAKVSDCQFCGEALDDTPATDHERRTKIDIIFFARQATSP